MNRSSKYQFYLPQNTDPISVSDFNYNFTLIDSNLITASQSWTSTQKSTARENLGLGTAATNAVANNLTTDSSGSVLDARQGKALNDKITAMLPSAVIPNKSMVTAQTVRTLNLPNNGRFLFVCPTSSSQQRQSFAAIVSVSGQGTVYIAKLFEGAGVTVSGTTNKFIITLDSAATSFPAIMAFATNATHLAAIEDA